MAACATTRPNAASNRTVFTRSTGTSRSNKVAKAWAGVTTVKSSFTALGLRVRHVPPGAFPDETGVIRKSWTVTGTKLTISPMLKECKP